MTERESRAEYMRAWRAADPSRKAAGAAAAKAWREAHPDALREQWKRQSQRRSAKGPRVRNTTTPCVRCGVLDRMPSGGCRPCTRERAQKEMRENPERVRELANARARKCRTRVDPEVKRARARASNLKRYGITTAQYDAMFAEQNGVCAICAESAEGSLHVDHDHATDAVRGLLCGNCNTAIGLFQEDAARMAAGAAYLQRFTTGAA